MSDDVLFLRRQLTELRRALPDDIRAAGWAVAVHNDYRLGGVPHTFWLFTQASRCVKGEGRTDAEALDAVREQLWPTREGPEPGTLAAVFADERELLPVPIACTECRKRFTPHGGVYGQMCPHCGSGQRR